MLLNTHSLKFDVLLPNMNVGMILDVYSENKCVFWYFEGKIALKVCFWWKLIGISNKVFMSYILFT